MLRSNHGVLLIMALAWAATASAYDASEFTQRLNAANRSAAVAKAPALGGGADTPQQLFNDMLAKCQTALNQFSVDAKARRARSENVAIGGTIAGVVGSALTGHASTIFTALMSGTSGAANAVQAAYAKEGDTSAQALTDYQAVRKDAMAAIDEFLNAGSAQAQVNALNKLNAKCTLLDIQVPVAPK